MEKEKAPPMEFPTNIPQTVVLEKHFKSGENKFGTWHGWNLSHDGVEKVLFATDALHEKIKDLAGKKVVITKSEKKGEKGTYNEFEVSTNGTKPATGQPALKTVPDVERERHETVGFQAHLLACAETAIAVAEKLGIVSDEARQACFATVCIDAQRRGVVLGENGKPAATEAPEKATSEQRKAIGSLCKSLEIQSAKGVLADVGCVDPETLTKEQAGDVIELLQKQFDAR